MLPSCTKLWIHSPLPHWCLKLMKSGVARAKAPCLKYLGVLSARIDAEKQMDDTLKDTKKNVWPEADSGLQSYLVSTIQVYLSLIWKAYSYQPLKLQCPRSYEYAIGLWPRKPSTPCFVRYQARQDDGNCLKLVWELIQF